MSLCRRRLDYHLSAQPLIEAFLGANRIDNLSFMRLAKRVQFAGLSRHPDTLSVTNVVLGRRVRHDVQLTEKP